VEYNTVFGEDVDDRYYKNKNCVKARKEGKLFVEIYKY